jgi:hypothetical protein
VKTLRRFALRTKAGDAAALLIVNGIRGIAGCCTNHRSGFDDTRAPISLGRRAVDGLAAGYCIWQTTTKNSRRSNSSVLVDGPSRALARDDAGRRQSRCGDDGAGCSNWRGPTRSPDRAVRAALRDRHRARAKARSGDLRWTRLIARGPSLTGRVVTLIVRGCEVLSAISAGTSSTARCDMLEGIVCV